MHRVATGVGLSYAAAAEREKELNQQIDQEKNRALALNDASLRDAILARAVETNRKLYKNVLERMTQMGMAAGVSASNVSVLDNAAPPLTPSSPKLLLTLASCGALALLIGVSSACFLERFDDTFKDADEVERYVGVPSLAVVPDFRKLIPSTYGTKKHLLSRFVWAEAEDQRLSGCRGPQWFLGGQRSLSCASPQSVAIRAWRTSQNSAYFYAELHMKARR